MSVVIVEVSDLTSTLEVVRAALMPDVLYEDFSVPTFNAGDAQLIEVVSGLLEYHVGLEQELSCIELLDLYNESLAEMLEEALNGCRALRNILHVLKYIQLTDRTGTVLAYL